MESRLRFVEKLRDPHFLPLLLALGVNSLSVASPMLSELKFFARRFTLGEAQDLLIEFDHEETFGNQSMLERLLMKKEFRI